MLKLIVAMLGFLLIAAALLGLRQRQIDLTSQCAHLYARVLSRQHILWDQQTQISANTNTVVLGQRLAARAAAATQAAAQADAGGPSVGKSGGKHFGGPVVEPPVAPVPLSSLSRDGSESGGP